MSDRNGIEIDYCPTCRGVWLDRGELDKIIERSAGDRDRPDPRSSREERRDWDDDDRHGHHGSHKLKHKKKSMLGELFDF